MTFASTPAYAPTLGTPLSDTALRVMLLGSGELGKEVIISLQRLGVEVIAVDLGMMQGVVDDRTPRQMGCHHDYQDREDETHADDCHHHADG